MMIRLLGERKQLIQIHFETNLLSKKSTLTNETTETNPLGSIFFSIKGMGI